MKRDELYITIEPDDIKHTAFTLVNSSDLKNYKDDHYTWSMKVSGSVEHINMLGDGGVICYGGNIGSIDVRNGRLNISHNATVSNIRELGGWVSYDDISTIHFMTSVLQGSIVTTPFTIHHVTTFKDCEILNEGTVYEYGVLKDSHIGKNGYVLAKAHSIVDSVVVSDGGHLFAEDKAHLKNIYIAKGGSISICPRTHTHHVTACTGSTVYVNPEVKEESLKRIKMEEGVEVKTHDEEFDKFMKFPIEPGPVITDDKTQVYRYLRDADDLNDQSDLYLTLYTTTDKVEDFEFEYLLVHILNHNYKLYCKMHWWNGDSKPCKLEKPYKFMNPLDPRDKATFEYRGLLHLKDCYLVDAETDMSVGDLDFLTKADILGMTYRSTKDFRCLIDKNGSLFRQKNLYVCDEPLCYECLGDPLCKPDDTPEEKQEKYDWQKTPQELSEQYPDNLILGGYSADNICTLREIYLEYNRFGYDKPITCHIGFKNATVNFNPETNCMTVRLIDWGLWNPEDQSVFEHDCILDSIKITGWGYDHDTKGFYVPHFSEVWYNGKKVNVAEKTENSRIVNFLDYGVMISTTKPMLNALKNIPNETKDVLAKSLDDMIDDAENVISSNLVIHCRTNYQDSYISWIEVEFPGVDKTEKSIYIAFWNKPEISYNPETNIYSFIFKDQDWSLRQIDDENKVSDRNKSWIKDAKITHISFHDELPKNFQFDLIDVKYGGETIAGPPFVKFGIWGALDNPNTTESKGSIGLYDPNEDTKLHPEKKKEEVVENLKDAVEKTTQKALAEKNLKPKAEKELQDDTVDYSTVNWYKQPDDKVPVHKETVYKKIITCDMYPLNNIQVRSLSEKEVQMGAFEDKSPKKEYYPVNFCTDLHIEGSTASKVTVLDGGYVWLHSGYVDDIWVYPGGSVRIDSSECYGNIYECGGYVDFDGDEQNTVNGNDVYDLVLDNQMSTVHKGTTFFRVRIQNGVTLIVRGEVDYLIAEREATDCNEVQVMDGGTLKKSCVEAGTKIVAFNGSTLEDVSVVRGGVLQIFKGARIKHCDICHGGALEVADDVDQNAEWFHKEIFQHLGSTVKTFKLSLFDEEDDVE